MNRATSQLCNRIMALVVMMVCALAINAKDFVVVLDAGHGGADAGAPGHMKYNGRITRECDVNLAVVLKAKKMLEAQKGIKVVLTRDGDKFLGVSRRYKIANGDVPAVSKVKADLMVSVHCNGSPDSTNRGALVLYPTVKKKNVARPAKESTDSLAGGEEGVIVTGPEAERAIKEGKRFAQLSINELRTTAGRDKRQGDGLVVRNDLPVITYSMMPAVLLELDFLCNSNSEKFLISDKGQEQLARAICNAIVRYNGGTPQSDNKSGASSSESKNDKSATPAKKGTDKANDKNSVKPTKPADKKVDKKTDKTTDKKATDKKDEKPDGKASNKTDNKKADNKKADKKADKSNGKSAKPGETVYKVQIFTSGRKLPANSPEFKGLGNIDYYMHNKEYKYTYGSVATREEAQKLLNEAKKHFSGAFIVTFVDGKRVTP